MKGYLNSDAYYSLRKKLVAYKHVQWNVGVGHTACFTQAISSIIQEEKIRSDGPFDHVIEVDMKQASTSRTRLNINDRLAIKLAEQLGLLSPNQEYSRLKEEDYELQYYTYGMMDCSGSLHNLSRSMGPHILRKLLGKKYTLVVQNLDEPIKTDALTQAAGIPPPAWKGSFWLMSTTSRDVYEDSKSSDYECAVESFSGDDILILTVYSLHQAAKDISNVIGGDKDEQHWQISRQWLTHCPRGPTTLIVRRCSPSFFPKLDQLLPKLLYLHVLDLSYTEVESLPPSVCYLQKLQLLFLKGCHKLTNPFSFPSTIGTLPGKNSNNRINLLHLDLSYSNVETFDSDFFHNMPSLQELLLVGCSNLVELPPSVAALSSITILKLTRTRIKSFNYWEIFHKTKKLHSLELINDIEGWECRTEEELKLEGHPTMRSFSLVGAPHIRRLSLNGCRNLVSVDSLKEIDALEELDLSATGIKELPADILNLPRLGQLLLIGVPALRRFPWHDLKRLPDMFCLDQRLEGNGVHSSPQIAQMVSTSNSRLFYSFNRSTVNLVRSGQLFKSFYIQVKSFKARFMKTNDEDDMVTSNILQVSVSIYVDVNHRYLTEGISMVSMDDMLPFRVTKRHVRSQQWIGIPLV